MAVGVQPVNVVIDQGVDWASATTAIATVATALILLVTAILALRSLADARRTRDGQLVVDLARRWDEPLIVQSLEMLGNHSSDALAELVRKVYESHQAATDAELEEFQVLCAAPVLIDMIGVLESEGVISAGIIYKMWGPLIVTAWSAWCDAVKVMQGLDDNPQPTNPPFVYFERLIPRLNDIEEEERAIQKAKDLTSDGDAARG